MSNKRVSRYWLSIVTIFVIAFGLFYVPLPYYISQPGDAVELSPIIDVTDAHEVEGALMLTTVRMGSANVFNYTIARVNNYMELIAKQDILDQFEDEDEYSRYQLQMMSSSQESAIIVAYTLAEKDITIENRGVIVTQTIEDMPAREKLRRGDVITHLDGEPFETSEELIAYVQTKQVGDEIEIRLLRNEEELTVTIELVPLPQIEGAEPRAGIGISTLTDRTVTVHPPVEINTRRIGGPSAGLMFTLEMYNQLIEEDITKGYRIAGTGSIDSEGNVGPIGGVHQKVVAADRAGADIFFAPHVQTHGAPLTNYERAVEAANDIGTDMEIVPVMTAQDALDYLEGLPVH